MALHTSPRRYLAASIALLLLPMTSQADPAIRTKANNTNNLDLTSSWVGGITPSAIEIGLWDATVLGANASALGSNRVWLGMRITNPGGAVTINPGNTLTLGYSGIDMSTATQNLTISSGLTLRTGHGQIWNIGSGATLFVNTGAFTRAPGSVLNIRGAGTVTTSNITNDANDLVGTWATIGTTTATQYATVSGGNIVGLAGTNAATAANVTDTTGAVNYNVAAVGALGAGANFSTLRYTGAGGAITGNFSANGLLNAGTGTLAMSGNITIGSSRELVVTTPDATRSINLSGAIDNHSSGASGFTKAGDGTVTLSGANTYSGLTSVSRGFLAVSHNSALGDTLSGTRITGSGRLTFNGGVTTSEALFIDMDMINDATIPASATPLTMSGSNTLAGHFRAGTQVRTSGGAVTTITGGISSTAVSTGTFVLGFSEFNITTTPMSIGTGGFYRDSGTLAVIGVAGNTWGSTSAYAGTIRTDVKDALPATATIQFGTTYTTGTFTLNLNGNDQTTSQLQHDSFVVAGKDRVITSTGGPATLTLNQSSTTNFNGRFQGEVSLVKAGTGRINLSGPSTTTGTFTVNGGTLAEDFNRASAAVSGASSVADNLPTAAPLTLGGGTFQLTGRTNGTTTSFTTASWAITGNNISTITVNSTAGVAPGQLISGGTGLPAGAYVVSVVNGTQFVINANPTAAQATFAGLTATANSFTSSQTFAGLTLNPGASAVVVDRNNGDGTVLNLGAITPNLGATVNFTLPTTAQSASNGITTATTNTNGILGGWARVGNDWATNSSNTPGGNIVAFTGYSDVTRQSSGPKTVASLATSNVRIIEGTGGSPAELTPAAAGTTDINTLLQSATGGAVTYNPGTTDILRLGASGGVMVGSGASALNIGASVGDGILTAGGAADTAGAIHLTNNHASNLLTINSTIADNGLGAVSVVTSGGGITVFAGANTHTGRTIVGSGQLRITSEAALGANPTAFAADQLTLAGGILYSDGTFSIDDTNRGITLTSAEGNSIQTNSGTLTVANVITGSGSLNKGGGGTLILSAANTYAGDTRITNGTLQVAHVNALQNSTLISGAITFAAGTATYNLKGLAGSSSINLGTNRLSIGAGNANSTTYTGVLSGTGGITKTGTGTLNLNAASTYSGDTIVNGGMLVLAHVNALQNSTLDTGAAGSQSVNLTNTGTYNFGGLKGADDLDMAVSDLSVGSNNQSTTFSGGLIGAFGNSFTKVGNGTLTLSGTGTYSGATNVNAGTLLVSGSIAGSATTVNNTATLGGSGGTTGAVMVKAGGTLAPGESIGTLTTKALSLESNATFDLEIDTTALTRDIVAVTGSFFLAVSNDVVLTVSDLDLALITEGTFAFITYTGTWNGGLFEYDGNAITDGGSLSVGGNQFTLDYDLNGNSVALIAVPEPGSLLSLAGGLGVLLGLARCPAIAAWRLGNQ